MKIILLFLIFSLSIFPQFTSSEVQQITNVDGDARNVSIELNTGLDSNQNIFFEVHKDSVSNIASIYCNLETGKFSDPEVVTEDSCLDINPKAIQFINNIGHAEDIVFFQTNKLGNWRLAYKIRKDTVWSETKFVDSSTANETHPTLFDFDPLYPDTLLPSILYEKNNSIYMAVYRDSSFSISEVFRSSDSVFYSQPTGVLPTFNSGNNFYVAVKKVVNNKSHIVYRSKIDTATQWEKEQIAVDNDSSNNPNFYYINGGITLTYENTLNRYSNIYFLMNWGSSGPPTVRDSLLDSLSGNVTDFKVPLWPSYIVVTKQAKRNMFSFDRPYAYKYLTDDSAFVDIKPTSVPSVYYTVSYPDTMIYTKVKSTSLAISDFSPSLYENMIFTVWEDSVQGHIQLLSNTYTIITGIKDENIPTSFQLYQNYPNPFNPSTKIEFYLAHNGFVKLTIYNILGKKVKELINGYMYSGTHGITFNADVLGLASGVYLYQLKAGDNVIAKKMILLK